MSIEQIVSLVTPAVIVFGAMRWLAGWLWKRFEAKLDEGVIAASERAETIKAELAAHSALDLANQDLTLKALDRIEGQTTQTNGRVSKLELQAAKVEGILIGKKEPPP